MQKRTWTVIALTLMVYAVVRLVLIPEDPLHANGMSHDASYLAIVAQNLLAGKGFVLDALWLVFLQPAQLPMPYHNANPLYPIVVAGTSLVFGVDVLRAGFMVSAVCSVILILALTLLLKKYVPLSAAFVIAFLVALFPPVWFPSWLNITDELWVTLMVAFVAALVRMEKTGMAFVAGAFLGLAWLTRSVASLAVLPAAVWMLMVFGWRKALILGAQLGVACVVVCLPWLIHTAKTWGSPLRSDSGMIMAGHMVSEKFDDMVIRVWHMPVPPPSLSTFFKANPTGMIRRMAAGSVSVVREFLRAAVDSSTVALLLLLAAGVLMIVRYPAMLKDPGFVSVLLYAGIFSAVMSIGGKWTEGRYFILVYVMIMSWLFVALYRAWQDFQGGTRTGALGAALAVAGVYLVFYLPRTDYRIAAFQLQPDPHKIAYMTAARWSNGITGGSPTLAGDHPYFYTLVTQAQALSIPESDDTYLLEFMKKYHARYIFLSEEERDFWRPAWKTAGPPPTIRLKDRSGQFYLYEAPSL